MQGRMTYWLQYGEQYVASVRAEPGLSEQEVRSRALANHERLPLCDRPTENPSERATKILFSTVRIFPGEA